MLRASAAEMKISNAPLSEAVWPEWEGLGEEPRLFQERRTEEWVEPEGSVTLSSGLESVMVLSLPESSSPEAAVSPLEALSIASLSPSLPSIPLSPSLSGSTRCCCVFAVLAASLFLARGVEEGANLRLAALLWAFSAFCETREEKVSQISLPSLPFPPSLLPLTPSTPLSLPESSFVR